MRAQLVRLVVFTSSLAPFSVLADSDCTGPNCLKLKSTEALGIPEVHLSGGLQSVLGIIAFLAGAISVFFIILAGIRYASSSGDPGRIESAKQTLLYSVIGLIVSLIAPFIVTFVIDKLPK